MAREAITPVFVPGAFEEGVLVASLLGCERAEGDHVAVGDVLVRLRAGGIESAIEAPLHGRLTRLHVRVGEPVHVGQMLAEIHEERQRQDRVKRGGGEAAGKLVLRVPALLACALAAVAFVRPFAGLVGALALALLVGSLSHAGSIRGPRSSAELIAIPFRFLAGTARWVRPTPWRIGVGVVVLAVLTAASVALSAGYGALRWTLGHGGPGTLAAARLAGYEYAGTLVCVTLSLWLLWRALAGGGARDTIRNAAARLPEPAVTAVAVAAVVWVALCVAGFEHEQWWPVDNADAVIGVLPDHLGREVQKWRADRARSAAEAVTKCVARRGRGTWRPPRAFLHADGNLLIGVRPEHGAGAGDRAVATLMLALANQLAPRAVDVSIVTGGRKGATIDFTTTAVNRPIGDFARIAELAAPGSAATVRRLAAEAKPSDREVALACSGASP